MTDDFSLEFEIDRILSEVDLSKIFIVKNLLGVPLHIDLIRQSLINACEYAFDLAMVESREGEWAYAEVNGWVVWCFIEDETGNPKFHVSYSIEHWDNLD